jgi:hypothetical protein
MESNYTGAERDDELQRHAALKKAKFDEVRTRLAEANLQPLNYEEFLKKAREIANQNRARKAQEEKSREQNNIPGQHDTPDHAA